MIDLEDYSFERDSHALIKATEETVLERIPPRVKVREKALLELPHIMLLMDDDKKEIIESIKDEIKEKDKIYDFDLMQKGGHIKGYLLSNKTIKRVQKQIAQLEQKESLLFAVGDGNHSLATAKTCYEKLKDTLPKEEYLNHPSRYALVELVNLHSDALDFEPIHRVLFNVDTNDFIKELKKFYKVNETGNGQKIEILTKELDKKIYIENPVSNLPVGSIQVFIDNYLKTHPIKIDYIHGEDTVKNLSKIDNNLGILLEPIKKENLFQTVIVDGVLPRKAFSMGHSEDKKFYLEARRIK